MKANEFRLGNIVMVYGTNGNPERWVEQTMSAENIKTCESTPEWFTGSQIDKETLLNWGFKETFEGCYTKFCGGILVGINKEKIVIKPPAKNQIISLNAPEYKHSMQNLIFSFTGEELTIKL